MGDSIQNNYETEKASSLNDDSDGEIEYLPKSNGNPPIFPKPGNLFIPKDEPDSIDQVTSMVNIIADEVSKQENVEKKQMPGPSYSQKTSPRLANMKNEMNDPTEAMLACGLPINFANKPGDNAGYDYDRKPNLAPNYYSGAGSYRDQETIRKGQKETFYCEFCLLELNSRDTLESHANGAKHRKKAEDYKAETRRAKARGDHVEEKQIRKIANPLPLQKKVPIRLNEKLRETTTSIVGLDSINEVIACSNAEVEPYYECVICGQQGEANSMFQHLQGKPHRIKFLQHKFPENPQYTDSVTFNKGFLESEIDRLNLRENMNLDKINTVYSDEMFPWTAGKAPWSVEQGGTGIVPTRARNRIGLLNPGLPSTMRPNHVRQEDSKVNVRKLDATFKDLDPAKLEGKLENDTELKHACALIQRLGEKVKDFKISRDQSSKIEVDLAFDQLDLLMETLSLSTENGFVRDSSPKRVRRTPSPRRSLSRERYGSRARRTPSPRQSASRESYASRPRRSPSPRRSISGERFGSRMRSPSRDGFAIKNERGWNRENRQNDRGFNQAQDYGRESNSRYDRGFGREGSRRP